MSWGAYSQYGIPLRGTFRWFGRYSGSFMPFGESRGSELPGLPELLLSSYGDPIVLLPACLRNIGRNISNIGRNRITQVSRDEYAKTYNVGVQLPRVVVGSSAVGDAAHGVEVQGHVVCGGKAVDCFLSISVSQF